MTKELNRIIALWTHPRAVSTAMERTFRERSDSIVLHEPFFHAYYTGPKRLSRRFFSEDKRSETTYESVIEKITAPRQKAILFFKDMAFYLPNSMSEDFLDKVTHTFLIRRPQDGLVSYHKISPDFHLYPEECGYFELEKLFNVVSQRNKRPPIVVDANDLCANPVGILTAYCHSLNISFSAPMLRWNQLPPPEWKEWGAWHTKAAQTTSFQPLIKHNLSELPEKIIELIQRCNEPYQRLYQYRIKPLTAEYNNETEFSFKCSP